jgi:hypothetical protein
MIPKEQRENDTIRDTSSPTYYIATDIRCFWEKNIKPEE